MSVTYKQPIKEYSRRMLWERAINLLTTDREKSRVLGESFARRLWDYVFDEHLFKYKIVDSVNEEVLESWCNFAITTYGKRSPDELHIAYFSGPEPENDLRILLELGIRIENVWAFESDRKIYTAALEKVQNFYPTLKLFHGSIESFFEFNHISFDIIYLDFTAPLFSREKKPFVTLHSIFEHQAISELGVLILTTSEPNPTDEVADFLTDYFYHQAFVEGTVLGAKTKEGKPIDWFIEGPYLHPLERPQLKLLIEKNIDSAYSAFCTQYPIMYSNLVGPSFRILKTPSAKRRIFNTDKSTLEQGIRKLSGGEDWLLGLIENEVVEEDLPDWGFGGDLVFESTNYPLWYFIDSLKQINSPLRKLWEDVYTTKERGVSRLDAIRLGDLLRSVTEGYFPILSPPLRDAIPSIYHALPDAKGGLFCDVPMPHLWIEVALNQLGLPYHPQIDQHFRIRYCAQKNRMLVDLFVFDRCRSFYDWLPMIELYGQDLSKLERQMISRICLNAIGRQRRWVVPQIYFATALIGYDERPWARLPELSPRFDLNDLK